MTKEAVDMDMRFTRLASTGGTPRGREVRVGITVVPVEGPEPSGSRVLALLVPLAPPVLLPPQDEEEPDVACDDTLAARAAAADAVGTTMLSIPDDAETAAAP